MKLRAVGEIRCFVKINDSSFPQYSQIYQTEGHFICMRVLEFPCGRQITLIEKRHSNFAQNSIPRGTNWKLVENRCPRINQITSIKYSVVVKFQYFTFQLSSRLSCMIFKRYCYSFIPETRLRSMNVCRNL